MLLLPFLIEVDSRGLTVRLRGVTTRLPWESVEALTVTEIAESWHLDIRLAPGMKLGGRLPSKRDRQRVYTLLPMDEFTVAPDEVIAALQRCGGDRIDAEQYLQHLAARRTLARFVAEYNAEQRRTAAEKGGGSSAGSDLRQRAESPE
ncbi:hypothetical protein [Micromonospora musae]|uniref:hypothetical protein n=1 Tax=Micromonospora musae TaxID=1894970 RepID=UPI0034148C46